MYYLYCLYFKRIQTSKRRDPLVFSILGARVGVRQPLRLDPLLEAPSRAPGVQRGHAHGLQVRACGRGARACALIVINKLRHAFSRSQAKRPRRRRATLSRATKHSKLVRTSGNCCLDAETGLAVCATQCQESRIDSGESRHRMIMP